MNRKKIIILFGAPGTGKGSQAKFITDKYKIPHISIGNLLRNKNEITKNSYIWLNIQKKIKQGKLVEDKIIIDLLNERINQNDCKNGFLLDGFPRTVTQFDAIKNIGILIDIVLEFRLPESIIMDRIMGRRIHLPSGRIYHIIFNPPKNEGKDDITGEELTIRQDDQPKIIQQRLTEYYQKSIPLVNSFKKEAKLGNIIYHVIDANNSINHINSELNSILK